MKTYTVAYREPRDKERDHGMILCRNRTTGQVRTFSDNDDYYDARRAAGGLGVIDTAMTQEELDRENKK